MHSYISKINNSNYGKLTFVLVLLTVFCFSLSIIRVFSTSSITYLFLIWNLFLAWIPFLISTPIENRASKKANIFTILPLCFIWILFLPNAPYIITDLFHLKYLKSSMPLWYDTVLILSYAWTGLLLGYFSIFRLQLIVSKSLNSVYGWIFGISTLTACSFGVYMGRFIRFNSWDLFFNPVKIISYVANVFLHPFQNTSIIGLTIVMSAFLILGYLAIWAIIGLNIPLELKSDKLNK